MEIKKYTPYHANFTSRNPKIRFADDVARQVNKSFPRISSSLLETHKFAKRKRFRELIWNISDQVTAMRDEKKDRIICADKLIDFIKAYIGPIKKYKVGNCGESAQLSILVAQANGIKNCSKASLMTSRGKDMDHAVVFVDDQPPYIIDSWLGFADTVPNAIQRYKGEFRHCFDGRLIKSKKLKFDLSNENFDFVLNRDLTKTEIKYLLKKHKDIILPKKKNQRKT